MRGAGDRFFFWANQLAPVAVVCRSDLREGLKPEWTTFSMVLYRFATLLVFLIK